MELIIFDKYEGLHYCPECGAQTHCGECQSVLDYCPECGASVQYHKAFIVLDTAKYHGIDRLSSHCATLIIDGKDCASAYVETDEGGEGGDVAYLQLSYIAKENQTEDIAKIISNFAKWVRFDWSNPDKNSGLPTLVRLLGMTTIKTGNYWQCEKWTALADAIQIKPEHLAPDFTSKEITKE